PSGHCLRLMSANFTQQLKKLLSAAGCTFVRHGKGDHDIWTSPISNKHFPVDSTIKSRHTANAVLRQAGLQKAF
ncbi:MAG: type II toxin-antitoxin system HicA family toxin, partial [Rectinemataceae bacterium]